MGCARNEVDSEELAGRLEQAGWTLADDGDEADVVLVNTCGFIQAAKQDSIDELLGAAGSGAAVVAAGCLAERYGSGLADALPEAQVLSFDDYANIADRLDDVVAGRRWAAHEPRDRRKLLPLTPSARPSAALKLASGCDRRCSFCAIPSFRGAFLSRRPADILSEARWLADQGVREIVLVSENSTSYGKDLGDLRLLETLLPELAGIGGLDWIRISYLQPAEDRKSVV